MRFTPIQTKFKKQQKGKKINTVNSVFGLNKLKFGIIGLKSKSSGRLTSKHLESIRQAITKIIKKSGRLIINIFPHTPITKKPVEVRMGKGKGNVNAWVAKVKTGVTICEIEISKFSLGIKALKLAQYRLPIKTKIFYN